MKRTDVTDPDGPALPTCKDNPPDERQAPRDAEPTQAAELASGRAPVPDSLVARHVA
jgi:hypothetical protein